ncbi:DUF6879 family protein [Streptomyces aidingensis]|uniref:DUF6879 domain-containing protein n=1 Tax=Streptomyces aidingensis TaxID=910347 RepID=A0A1I1LT42_9ACTN|nr:DUF6879 family protein [Streptomyces aidingensis]SFC72630.1 hypothetical protein SAMN05421773_105236 [Streptomyces aidingensis]
MLSDGEWRKIFDAFHRDAWRFEAQPAYTMPREADNFARFLRGDPKPEDHNTHWHERVRAYREAGKTIGRVRIVRQPLTAYQRYQFAWGIPGNLEAGEDIRILDVTHESRGLPVDGQDWWMFDDTTVVHLNYRPDGTQIGRVLHDGDAEPYRKWKQEALEASIPFSDYVREYG